MGKVVTLGGDRVGSEGKMKEYLHGYSRSSHDVGCIIATDQAVGTLVPYYCDIATNGTTYYINMATKVRTLPTNGPLFGTFKHQLDWYSIPIRLYIGALHNNALGIGLKMKEIKLPKVKIAIDRSKTTQKIKQDSLLAYVGIRDLGTLNGSDVNKRRMFPGIFLLAYWDIYKNYYANKQEEIGVRIGAKVASDITAIYVYKQGSTTVLSEAQSPTFTWSESVTNEQLQEAGVRIVFSSKISEEEARKVKLNVPGSLIDETFEDYLPEKWGRWVLTPDGSEEITDGIIKSNAWRYNPTQGEYGGPWAWAQIVANEKAGEITVNEEMELKKFPLENIDKMREEILGTKKTTEFIFPNGNTVMEPYTFVENAIGNKREYEYSQTGIGIKTYISDRFNNWLSTEWIDGTTNGINEITAVDVSDGKLTMDALILSKKLFNMLNRIAISGGSYNDWQEAVYGVNTIRLAESPMYCGGMSSEIVFDEVVANSGYTDENGEQALGSLAGRGTDKATKGGKSIKIRIEEPSMIMCIGSITPRIFYSQGNKWWNQLETMDDLHKPELDKIGFQELLTEEFAAFDTTINSDNAGNTTPVYHSVGKQPSWIQYMTRVNESFGSFAAGEELEWMVLNRKYEQDNTSKKVKDATTYIDPTMYNIAFADTKLTAKNFWVQIAFDIVARRKMSAKQIPNL